MNTFVLLARPLRTGACRVVLCSEPGHVPQKPLYHWAVRCANVAFFPGISLIIWRLPLFSSEELLGLICKLGLAGLGSGKVSFVLGWSFLKVYY